MTIVRLLRALNLPGLLAVTAFVVAVIALATALEPFAMTGA